MDVICSLSVFSHCEVRVKRVPFVIMSVVRYTGNGQQKYLGSWCVWVKLRNSWHESNEKWESLALKSPAALYTGYALFLHLHLNALTISIYFFIIISLLLSLFPDRRKDSSYPGHGRQNVSVWAGLWVLGSCLQRTAKSLPVPGSVCCVRQHRSDFGLPGETSGWMTWIVSLGHRDGDDREEKSACWVEGKTRTRGKTTKCGCVYKNHQGNRVEFGSGGPAVLQESRYVSSSYQARKILRVAVGWVGSWRVHVAPDVIADLKYLRKDLIQDCLRKINLRFVSGVFCERLPF